MAKLFFVSILTLTLISCGQLKPQATQAEEQIDNKCDSIMETFAKGNFSAAFDTLKTNTVIAPSTIDTMKAKTITYANSFLSAYGKIRSYEFISQHKIKDCIIKRFYILKFDKYYLKFAFMLYNNGDHWTITSFEYNEDLIELLY